MRIYLCWELKEELNIFPQFKDKTISEVENSGK